MIHYHGTPFSGDQTTAVRALTAKHAFVSLSDTAHIEIAAEVCQSFALDNGAFSMWKRQTEYNISDYVELVMHWYRHPGFDFYVIPDAIGADTALNQKLMATWFKAVPGKVYRLGAPVWHLHEDVAVLREYCNSYERVCIGSSAEWSVVGSPHWWQRMSEAMDAATDENGYPLAKLHGLRMLDPTVFSHLPLSSADSTNVARNIGMDGRWRGPYTPKSKETRAIILAERIEHHASASRWVGSGVGSMKNDDLFG